MAKLKFDDLIELNGVKLSKKYIESLTKKQRLDLVDPIFNIMRQQDFIYMDDEEAIKKSWKKLKDYNPDLTDFNLFNNSSLGTDICKYFCHTFYNASEVGKPTMIENFKDDKKLKRMIENRLGLDWLDEDERGKGVNEAFNLSFKMIAFQAQRSMRLVNATSMFKPTIAKYMCLKYSQPGDTVGDYSCGFGGRLLGAMSSGRKYIGTDPMTVPELKKMAEYFNFKDYTLIHQGSEFFRGDENSVDMYYSSPPYFNQEKYEDNLRQAYSKGNDYFYNEYWPKTMENVKYMLKPGKWFGLNVKNQPKMVETAKQYFGEIVEQIGLRTIKNHLVKHHSKNNEIEKYEYVYMFKNNK